MKIIISPAKKMVDGSNLAAARGKPVFLKETKEIIAYLRSLSNKELKTLWKCNDKITALNIDRLRHMDVERAISPAIFSFDGIQYQYMAPVVMSDDAEGYIQEHLRILSGFYGILKPFDAVLSYRLEMEAKAHVNGTKSLYDFWGDKFYREVIDKDRIIVNLASEEYAKAIRPYLKENDRFLTCTFAEEECDRLIQKGVYVKMARGEMVRFMAENEVEDLEELKAFRVGNYRFCKELSNENAYVFVREKGKKLMQLRAGKNNKTS